MQERQDINMRILMVEDDKELCRAVAFQLERENYDYDLCHNGQDAFYYIERFSHDLLILDRMLPEMDGLALLQKIRDRGIGVPVIMVTAMNGIHDRVDGLDSGADDYLVKPFDMEELLARIRALLRRPRKIEALDCISYQELVLDKMHSTLTMDDRSVNVSKRESALLEFFMLNPEQILTREQILSRIWGDTFVEDGNIDNYIYFLRRRLKAIKAWVEIKTIHGIGYRMECAHGKK